MIGEIIKGVCNLNTSIIVQDYRRLVRELKE